MEPSLRAGAADGGQGVTDTFLTSVSSTPTTPFAGPRGSQPDALAADHLHDVATVYRRDPESQVAAIAVYDEGKYVTGVSVSRE